MTDLPFAPPSIVGTTDNDILTGTIVSELIFGLEGDDRLIGNGGSDRLDGGDGFDTVSYTNLTTSVVVDLKAGTATDGRNIDVLLSIEAVIGTGFDDILIGSDGDDFLSGGFGKNTLRGGNGNDRITGGFDSELIVGGHGIDTLTYANSWQRVIVNLTTNTAMSGAAEGDTILGIENLVGSSRDDELYGDFRANRLSGNAGDDLLSGEGGDDFLTGGRGDDYIDGGAGFDTASYVREQANVAINTRSGQMLGAAAGDELVSIEALVGTRYNDSLIMGDGYNRINGGAGDDFLDGGDGNDLLIGGEGADFLHGGAGVDTVSYRSSDAGVTVFTSGGANTGGDAQGDVLSWIHNITGSLFDDALTGDILRNRLRGSDGDDVLTGRGGSDDLLGGDGADSFAFVDLSDHVAQQQDDSLPLAAFFGSGFDRIRDFAPGEDLLRVDASLFGTRVVNTDDVADLGLHAASDKVLAFSGSDLFHVQYEGVSNFAAELVSVRHLAHLTGVNTLSSADFDFV